MGKISGVVCGVAGVVVSMLELVVLTFLACCLIVLMPMRWLGGRLLHYKLAVCATTMMWRLFTWQVEHLNDVKYVWYLDESPLAQRDASESEPVTLQRTPKLLAKTTTFSLPTHESAIVISNHISAHDWLVTLALARRSGMLGFVKFFMKESLKFVPGLGLGGILLGFVFLSRDWTKDNSRIEETFSVLKSLKMPFWLMTFLEGTRPTAEKLEASRQYAKQNNLPALNHLLLPRTKGVIASIQSLRDGSCEALYDLTVVYEGSNPNLLHIGTHGVVHVRIRRFVLQDLPATTTGLHDFFESLWVDKDRALDFYAANKSLPGNLLAFPDYVPMKFTMLHHE
ncbi:1-acyl-sn-glycerol-3-phosphate acyltransferase PLS1 [Pelomyxa schiedti]|nr:1-acyl-sn-glycerol-3-phosphate acyltransferase PLS1 [Pelomyxa schiedti]